VGFGVRSDGSDGAACDAVEGGFGQVWGCGLVGARGLLCRPGLWGWGGMGVELGSLVVVLGLRWTRESRQFGYASLEFGYGGQVRVESTGDCVSQHIRHYYGFVCLYRPTSWDLASRIFPAGYEKTTRAWW